jgi:cell wall-associated NlpC family hydrolase
MALTGALTAVGELGGAAYGPAAAPPTTPAPTWHRPTVRIAGADRYATAAAVSAATFPAGAPVAYVATGGDYPDALTAAAAAGGRGPVLLAGAGGVPDSTRLELERLHPSRVVIVGGPRSLPTSTEGVIRAALPGASVVRVQGADRYATAALLSSATYAPGVPIAYVATGTAFPDALTAAAAAARRGPVLLVPSHGLSAPTSAELNRLQPRQIVIVGGLSAVPMAAQTLITWVLRNSTVRRIAGGDRYTTAASVADDAYPGGAATVYLATGTNFPDALTAAAAAGGRGPVLLVPPGGPASAAAAEVGRLGPARIVLVGGTAAVSDAAAAEVSLGGSPGGPPPTGPTTSAPAPSTTAIPTSTTVGPTVTLALATTTAAPMPIPPPPPPLATAPIAVRTAEAQIGKPYVWAGAGPDSFDCSGLTMFAWAAAGVRLPHNAAAQAAMLPPVAPDLADLQPGDLLFYDTPIDHVTIYVGNGMMVEAAHSGVPVRMVPVRTGQLVGAGRP